MSVTQQQQNQLNSLYNIDFECNLIATVIQFPDTYIEVNFLTAKDFGKTNSPVWQILENTILMKGTPTPIVLAEKMKSIGITLEGIENYDYLSALLIRPIDRKGAVSIAKELKKLSLVRTIYDRAARLQDEVVKLKGESAKIIIDCVDQALGKSLLASLTEEKVAVDVMKVMPKLIEERGNNPDKHKGIWMPHPTWNKVFGALKPKQLYCLLARQGASKSTFLMDVMRKLPAANLDKPNLKILYLDTEMDIEDLTSRWAAASIGCPYNLIDTGEWRKSPEWFEPVRKEMERIETGEKDRLYFEKIGNMGGKEMDRYVRSWYTNVCGRENPCVIIYDYLKITNQDKSSAYDKEYELGYAKCEMLKDLADYCSAPLWTALQTNRSGIVNERNADAIDDSSASISDRIGWLVAWMGILLKRTPEQVLADTISQKLIAPSHILKHTKTRYLGREGPHYVNYIKVQDGKEIRYKPNFINLNVRNFDIQDEGSYEEWLSLGGRTKIKIDNKINDTVL